MLPVISASRRTDLVRCHPRRLAQWLSQGWVIIKNPYSQQERRVDLRPEEVHTLVLWSKDFTPLLENQFGLRDLISRYQQCYFHFTITGLGQTAWEPGVIAPGLAATQLAPLVALAGDPRRVMWRFDPLLFWQEGHAVRSNARAFDRIAEQARKAGLTQVMMSLAHWYQKSRRRAGLAGLTWMDPKPAQVQRLSRWLLHHARAHGLQPQACCHPGLVTGGFSKGQCINGDLLTGLHPKHVRATRAKSSGQRQACGCTHSIDIGSYDLACPHGCVYCYANAGTEKKGIR